jgi:hypothetical protein
MIFKIIPQNDIFLEKIYEESMKDLNEFYEIRWEYNLPKIVIIDDRKTIDLLKGKETETWVTGWSEGGKVYLLNRENLEKESSHKYSPDQYSATVKHELSHSFYRIISNNNVNPRWLWEGVAIHTSGQNKYHKKPSEFSKFLEFYDHGGKGVYDEPGFFVEGLVKKFSKQKLLNFIKEQSKHKTKEEFERFFVEAYGFNLNYEEINKQDFLK